MRYLVLSLAGLSLTVGCTSRALSGEDDGPDSGQGMSSGDAPPNPTGSSGSMATTAGEDDGCNDGCPSDLGDPGDDDGVAPDCEFGQNSPAGLTPLGGPCIANVQCESRVCEIYGDYPPQQGTCLEQDAECGTHAFGTLVDAVSGDAVPGVEIKMVSLIQAIASPTGASALALDTSGGDGRFAMISEPALAEPIGVVLQAGNDPTYVLSAMVVASSDEDGRYDPATGVHDLWALQHAHAGAWSMALAADPEIKPDWLPLVQNGGALVVVIDEDTGDRVAGCTAANVTDPQDFVARYVDDDGISVTQTATSSRGLVLLFGGGASPDPFEIRCPNGSSTQVRLGSWAGTLSMATAAVSG